MTFDDAPEVWPEDATHDELIGAWKIYQRKRGHRTSTDDFLTAWLATDLRQDRRVERYLDLGCGIGSVLLLAAYALRPDRSVGVEAQPQSALMARRTVSELPDPPAIEIVSSDFRDVDVESLGTFDLITGSPPYLPVGTGVMSPDPQRRACRFEIRGGVEAYCEKAAELLEPNGELVLVFQTQWDDRVLAAAEACGFHLAARADVTTRGEPTNPFLSVYGFRHEEGPMRASAFSIRDEEGIVTPEWQAARKLVGLRPQI